ncbi:unnamed protein product [Rotaria magnacalcarata]|uniref:Uncharacterized protein n=2 Tax=Rotaria magnacalcarata TaxID=392030 RepID=A0A816G1M4_9BILA|nr:unnamed protein product [Rotaria magnacalcarata]CAF1668524.1 unnamed protein product [Rotaria magnacalcarata]CAF2140542.1 unnamed protein product [Rotaria magnacalcarata]CAF2273307.1 unnamed protein product [Rotaria magnacalcarata]
MATSKGNESWSQILLDKVVVITGAGIGSAISHTCALQGAKVVVSDVNKAAADKVVADIIATRNQESDRIMSIELDTVDEQAIEQAVAKVVEEWGTIHVLVNAYNYAYSIIETPPVRKLAASLNMTLERFAQTQAQKQCMKRIGTPKEIANLVVFLASDLCPFITGANLLVDGDCTTI